MAFDDFAVVMIIQEDPSGFRSMNDCTRIWRDGRVEQLGWPRVKIHYRSGTRIPTGATIDATDATGTPVRFEVESKLPVPIHVGGGYGGSAGGGGERVVTHAELERHCTRASAWVAVNGEVYDITRFADRHPGGVTAILGQAGRDGSEAFRLSHAPYIDVRERLADCRVGRLSG
jgi:predicted heme/steroid binding protein